VQGNLFVLGPKHVDQCIAILSVFNDQLELQRFRLPQVLQLDMKKAPELLETSLSN
jgi:hypothetical protein